MVFALLADLRAYQHNYWTEMAMSGTEEAGSEHHQIYTLPRIGGLFHDWWYPHTTL